MSLHCLNGHDSRWGAQTAFECPSSVEVAPPSQMAPLIIQPDMRICTSCSHFCFSSCFLLTGMTYWAYQFHPACTFLSLHLAFHIPSVRTSPSVYALSLPPLSIFPSSPFVSLLLPPSFTRFLRSPFLPPSLTHLPPCFHSILLLHLCLALPKFSSEPRFEPRTLNLNWKFSSVQVQVRRSRKICWTSSNWFEPRTCMDATSVL